MSKICPKCNTELNDDVAFCVQCGANLNEQPQQVPPMQPQQTVNTVAAPKAKSKIAAGILGILLGAFGVHNFYLGYTGKAVAQLLISILSCGMLAAVSSIWGLVEGIMILTGSIDRDGNGNLLGE